MSDDCGLRPSSASAYGLDSDQRYRILGEPVAGVAAGRDVLLDRPVGLRAVPLAEVPELEHQARFLAQLGGTGVPVVYDLVRRGDGAMLVQRDLDGVTLAQAVAAASTGQVHSAIADPARCALTIARVCDILEAAHHRQIVHRALTPAAVFLTVDGSVVVDSWQRAMESQARPATRRFVAEASATERALRLDGLTDDVRDAAMCLYLAVVREPPPRSPDGALAGLSMSTRQVLPLALEGIVTRALAVEPGAGYASAAELAEDLRRFATGHAPEVMRRDPLSRLMLTLHRHQRGLLVAAALTAVLLAIGVAAWGTRLHAYAVWGRPVVEEDFGQPGWLDRWQPLQEAAWAVKDQRLVSTAPLDAVLTYRQLLSPPVAIEYTGRIPIDQRPGDLSVWWCEDVGLLGATGQNVYRLPGVMIQAGAYENAACIISRNPGGQRGSIANRRLTPGVDHRFRVEIGAETYRMWVNGELVTEWTDIVPPSSGYVSLYSYFPGQQIDDVRIWQQAVPERVSPLAIGDTVYREGQFELAARLYGKIASAHAATRTGQLAIFRKGLAERRAGDRVRSVQTWEQLADSDIRHRAESLRIDDLAADGQLDLAAAALKSQWSERPAMRTELAQRWQSVLIAINKPTTSEPVLDDWLALRTALFPGDVTSGWVVPRLLLSLGRTDEVLASFASERRAIGQARLMLGRTDEILADPDSSWQERGQALVLRGELEAVAADPRHYDETRSVALSKLGRFEEAASLRHGTGLALLLSGRAAEVLDRPSDVGFSLRKHAMIALGRLDELLAEQALEVNDWRLLLLAGEVERAVAGTREDLTLHRMIQAITEGDLDRASQWRTSFPVADDMSRNFRWVRRYVGLALVDAALGDVGALRAALARASQLPAHSWGGLPRAVARAALADPDTDDLAEIPWRSELRAWRQVVTALRAELAGDAQARITAWQAYLALPPVDRFLDEWYLNLDLEAIAAWRAQAP